MFIHLSAGRWTQGVDGWFTRRPRVWPSYARGQPRQGSEGRGCAGFRRVWTGSARGPGTDCPFCFRRPRAPCQDHLWGVTHLLLCSLQPQAAPWKAGNAGPLLLRLSHPRPQGRPHSRVQPRRAAWRVLLLRPEEQEDGTGVPEWRPGRTRTSPLPSLAPWRGESRSAPGTATTPGPPGSMAKPRRRGSGLLRPPKPDTSAFRAAPRPVHGCRPDLRVVALTAGRVWPDPAPPGEVLTACPGSPPLSPAASRGAWPGKHRLREVPLPAPRAQARFAVVGRVFRGLRGRVWSGCRGPASAAVLRPPRGAASLARGPPDPRRAQGRRGGPGNPRAMPPPARRPQAAAR